MSVLVVTVKPGSKRAGVTLAGDEILVRVSAPAREGLANEAARKALAQALGLTLRDVRLVRGAAARTKAFAVAGLEREVVLARLRRGAG